jgi:tetratricopeptide (TPR) repeat protein
MLKTNLFKIAKILILLITQLYFTESFADDSSINNDIVKEIEKTLLFDKYSREKINIYKASKLKKKSDYTIGQDFEEKKNKEIDIVIVDSKAENFDLRQKEKLAYNAVLIGQYEVALELYKQVIAAESSNYYSKFSLAVVYQKLGQINQAKKIYRDLLKIDSVNEEEVIGNLLAILIEESPKDSLYLLSRLTTQNPKSAYVLAQASVAYEKMKNYDQAIKLLQKALEIDPEKRIYI